MTLPDDIAARLEGKSSLGRLGLLTHSTAGFIDPGFSGHVTLELSNVATLPILLWPGMKIGQMCFFRLSSAVRAPVRLLGVRLAVPGPARPDGVAVVAELPPDGRLSAWRARLASRPATPSCAAGTCSGCPEDVGADEVEVLAISRFAQARWEDTDVVPQPRGIMGPMTAALGIRAVGSSTTPARTLRLARLSTLTGPYRGRGRGRRQPRAADHLDAGVRAGGTAGARREAVPRR